ncbi:MAG TPA: hypothetical protein VKG79_04175 [Bryobacteraceae bacterium]|nr:hypothetical protein [Bryobacteraceae bacterium]
MVYRADDIDCFEPDGISVSGGSQTPGLKCYLPGTDLGIYCASHTWKVSGTFALRREGEKPSQGR